MWKLQPIESGGEPSYLLPGNEYVVGRKNCDIILPNDQSVSRAHAQLTASSQTLTLKDSSKYGTFVNDEQIPAGTLRTLQPGDRLTFGVFHSKFRVEQECVVVCSSCLDGEGKASLSRSLLALGGRLVGSWTQECTHLVMPSVKVTIKTICALLCCRPVVKLEFFTELCSALQQRQSPPKAERFYPEIDEPSLTKEDVDLSARPERKRLFSGKTFLFLNSKQMKRLSQAVSCGGGRSQLLDDGSVPVPLLESPGSCVVDMAMGNSQALVPASTRKWADSVSQVLLRKGLRFITESEIGLAAIYVSTEMYCNPCSAMETESARMKAALPGATLSQNAAVDETVLPAASQNITAYVANTETSASRTAVSEVNAVGETPERRRGGSATSSRAAAVARDPPGNITEKLMSSHSAGEGRGAEPALSDRKQGADDDSAKFRAPLSNGGARKSPPKQSALTSFFQPGSKKRPREGSANSDQSEAKLLRKEEEEEAMKRSAAPTAQQTDPTTTAHTHAAATHTSTHKHTAAARAQSQLGADQRSTSGPGLGFSTSLGLGPALGLSSEASARAPGRPGGSQQAEAQAESTILGGKKRKELVPDESPEPEQPADEGVDLDLSIDELESIMSQEMDEPLEPAANKKQRLDQEESAAANKKQRSEIQERSTANKNQHLEQDTYSSANRKQSLEREESSSANRKQSLEPEESSSANRKKSLQPVADVKEEEVSFMQASKPQNGLAPVSQQQDRAPHSVLKQEPRDGEADSALSPAPDSALPRRLILVEFKSLMVSPAPARPRPDPLRPRDPNGKNFKCFRKVPVPGAQGLPNIIGGSDLVAHNRGKSSELEEWLRDAAEEEKQNEREETLGDDLFRYNPKPTKRR